MIVQGPKSFLALLLICLAGGLTKNNWLLPVMFLAFMLGTRAGKQSTGEPDEFSATY